MTARLPYRVFFGHRKDAKPDDAMMIWLSDYMAGALPDRDVLVVSGVDDWTQNMARCGGWEGWARHVGAGGSLDGQPSYHAVVVPDRTVGRSTAQLIEHALAAGRRVFRVEFDGDTPTGIQRIRQCRRTAGDSWTDYAELLA